MKKLFYSFLLLFSFTVIILLACTEDEISQINKIIGSQGGSITSSDGRLSLDIPAGALDEDTKITIRRINDNNLPPEFQGLTTNHRYNLQPDDLQFGMPVEVEFLTDQKALDQDGNITVDSSLLFASVSQKLEPLGNLETIIDADDDTVINKGTLEHFSVLVEITAGITTKIENVPEIIGINIPFTIDVNVIDSNSFLDLYLTSVQDVFYSDKSLADIFPLTETNFVFEVVPLVTGSSTNFKTSFDYICDNTEATTGIFAAQIDIMGEREEEVIINPFSRSLVEFVDFEYKQTLANFVSCPEESPPPLPTPTPTPTATPTPTPTEVGCADIDRIEFEALIESLAGQTSQQVFITPNACDMSRITITNDNNGAVVTDDVPDGSGGGFPTLTGPTISENPMQDPSGKLCDLSAFGRDDVSGGNDVGIQALGQFVVTPQGAILFRLFQVSYGIDTPVQDWFGDPFIVNCEPDP